MILISGFEKLSLHAPVGLYLEEKVLGNEFLMDVEVAMEVQDGILIENIESTVDYSQLERIARENFTKGSDLMETGAQLVIQAIRSEFKGILGVRIKVRKLHPMTLPRVDNTFVELKTGYFAK